jgi:NAD-dependent SIR2 family protein deacetylase
MPHSPSLALFLGAGVSRPLGFPLTAEILPLILRRHPDKLGDLLSRLLPALFEEGTEPPLITDLLSLVDQLLLDGHALGPELGSGALDELRTLLDRAIAEVLEQPVEPRGAGRRLLVRMVDWLMARQAPTAVITTNYDLAVESRLYSRLDTKEVAAGVDFGVSWRPGHDRGVLVPRPQDPRLRFFKLHGSLDWMRCALCGYLTVDLERGPAGGTATERAAEATCACGYRPLRHIFVAPSMVRELREPNLLAVWHGALEALRTADEWIVIGYSLPPEDVTVRSLLLRAFRGRPHPPSVRVVETASDSDLENRYRVLFSEVSFQVGGVEGFVDSLASPLQ